MISFCDTFKSLRGDAEKPSVSTASVDLREQKESYIVRLNLPDRDLAKVAVTLEGDTLRIVTPAGGKTSRYEQTLALAGAVPGAVFKIERMTKTASTSGPATSHRARYLQVLTLPGSVQADKMKVERKEGILTVTLPKA